MLFTLRVVTVAGLALCGTGLQDRSGTLERYDLAGKPAWQVVLPDALAEISGLAFTPDGRLFAHGDEQAILHQLDPRSGRIVSAFALAATGRESDLGKRRRPGQAGGSVVAGDFEDIAIVGDRFFLVTSNGILLEFREGRNGSQVPYTAHLTGLGRVCEIEGLAHDVPAGALLMLCKNRPGRGRVTQVQAYAWALKTGRVAAAPRFSIPYSTLARVTGAREFNGSAIAVSPGGRSFVLVAGPQQTFAEVTPDGRVLRGGAFPRGIHRQPESAAFAPDGSLVIGSEAAGRHATLAGYLPARS